jgi:hypothetical protein
MDTNSHFRQLWIHSSQEQPGALLKSTATVVTQPMAGSSKTVWWVFKDSEQVKHLATLMQSKDKGALLKSMASHI